MQDQMASKLMDKYKKGAYHTTLTVVRHGSTKLNDSGKIRGWADVDLDEKGQEEAKEAGEELKKNPPDLLVVSDMKRTQETAEIISKITGSPIKEVSRDFRPWDLGDLTGQSVKGTLPIIQEYAKEKPDEKIPGGESFNSFKKRFLTGLEEVIKKYKGKNIGIVTHHRGDRIIDGWIKGDMTGDIDMDSFLSKGIDPGAVIIHKI